MKILLISNFYPPYILGGYEICAYEITKELKSRGHKVYVLTSRSPEGQTKVEDSIDRSFNLNADFHKISKRVEPLRRLKAVYFDYHNYKMTKDAIKKFNPDLVYIWSLDSVSLSPILAAQRLKLPIVYYLASYWMERYKTFESTTSRFWQNPFVKMIGKAFGSSFFKMIKTDHMIAASRALKRVYVEAGFDKNSFKVIYLGASEDLLKQGGERLFENNNIFKLLYVGQLDEKKGVHIAIQALAYLVNHKGIKDIQLDIVGAGKEEYLQMLKQLVLSTDLDKYVNFLGKMECLALLNFYKNHHLLLVPSIWIEPFAGVIVEGLSAGLGVVATRIGGSPEIINNGENGLLIEPNNIGELAEAIMKCMKDRELLKGIGLNGRKTVVDRFNLNNTINLIEDYLIKVYASHK